MIPFAESCLLFADRNLLLRDMGSGFRDRREHFELLDLWPWAAAVVAIAIALAIVSRWLARKDSQRAYNNPRELLRSLCLAHGLDRSDERLLGQLARCRGLDSPLDLFLDPQAFELDDDSQELLRDAQALAALRAKLFDAPAPTDEEEPPADADQPGDSSAGGASAGEPPALDSQPVGDAVSFAETDATPESTPDAEPAPDRALDKSAGLFQPIPATVVAGGSPPPAIEPPDPVAEDRVPGEQREPTMTELQAVRALETLMRQIRASNAGAATSAQSATETAPQEALQPRVSPTTFRGLPVESSVLSEGGFSSGDVPNQGAGA